MVHLIVAMTPPGVIGNNGKLPWHIPTDLKHFKTLTSGNAVIMGRKTFDSLNMPNGLPNRLNYVISRNPRESTESVKWVDSIESSIRCAQASSSDIYIIGGATIYKEALTKQLVDKMHISFVHGHYEGDTKFPSINNDEWDEGDCIDKGDFIYIQYTRKKLVDNN